eukprot:4493108-Amphidinium_carterae.1
MQAARTQSRLCVPLGTRSIYLCNSLCPARACLVQAISHGNKVDECIESTYGINKRIVMIISLKVAGYTY